MFDLNSKSSYSVKLYSVYLYLAPSHLIVFIFSVCSAVEVSIQSLGLQPRPRINTESASDCKRMYIELTLLLL